MTTAIAPMKAQAWAYTTTSSGVVVYDVLNSYQTDPIEVIKSKIIVRLSIAKGEWGPDPDFGIPIATIKQNLSNPDSVAQLIADEILKVQNVNGCSLVEDSFDANLRIYTASFKVTTVYGETTVGVTI